MNDSENFRRVLDLVENGDVKISDHGYDELSADGISVREVIESMNGSILLEDYPEYPKGPCVLLLQTCRNGDLIHVVWGIPKGYDSPAVLITAYRPDSDLWEEGYTRRKS